MASPQLEDGFFRIANEIAEAMGRLILNSEESRCLWVLFRFTYGYGKKSDKIGLSQFSEATGMARPHVCRALASLKNRNIITVTPGYRNQYTFQKDHTLWINKAPTTHEHVTSSGNVTSLGNVTDSGNNMLPDSAMNVTSFGNNMLPDSAHSKERKTIDPKTLKTDLTQTEKVINSDKLLRSIKQPDEDPYTYAQAIAKAAGYEGYPNKAEACKQAKTAMSQKITCGELAGCVAYMLETNGAFWATQTLTISSAMRQLPAYQKAVRNGWKPGDGAPERGRNGKHQKYPGPASNENPRAYYHSTIELLERRKQQEGAGDA